jgi:hypothetical protein
LGKHFLQCEILAFAITTTVPVYLTSAVESTIASVASALPGGSCGWQLSAAEENHPNFAQISDEMSPKV